MAQNFIQPGDVIDYTVPAATTITSGQGVLMGDLFGVALVAGVTGDVIPVAVDGVYSLPKLAAQAQAIGVKVYFDPTPGTITTTAGALKHSGYVARAAAANDATVYVKLLG